MVNKIKFYREPLGLSVYELARITKLSPSYISNLENDNRKNPSKEVMSTISKALGHTISEVFFPEEGTKEVS